MSIDPTGYTLAHEHLHIDLSGFKNNVDCRLDQYAFICQEMNDLMTRGVRNVIEMTNRYMGRNAQFMLDVMRETGINVVACTGYYQDAFFPEHVATRSVQELAQEMVDEIEQGIDGTDLKAGIIAEIGSSEGKITPLEEKVFIAAALAHNQTGRPISTHTSFSTMGLEQLALLQAHGVDHTAGNLGHAGRRVARPGLGGAALSGDGAQLGDIKEVLELPTVAEGTGCGVDGVLHLDAAEIDGHVHGTH